MLLRLSTHLINNASVENVKTKKNSVWVHVNATDKKKVRQNYTSNMSCK